MSKEVQFAPVKTGRLDEIPPDAPAGSWLATCAVKKGKTNKDSFPMLILEWQIDEDLSGENGGTVGKKVTDFLPFFPEEHAGSKMSKIRLKAMCDALDIAPPTTTSIQGWSDIGDFIDALDGTKATIYTEIETRKDTGEANTRVTYVAPKGSVMAAPAEVEREAPKTKGKPAAKSKRR